MTQKSFLSHELSNLINPQPTFEDPEDEGNIDTANSWIQNVTEQKDDLNDIATIGKIRKKQISVLSQSNKRYIGKKVSREDLESSDENDEGQSAELDDESNQIQSDESSEDGDEELSNNEEDVSNDDEEEEESEIDESGFEYKLGNDDEDDDDEGINIVNIDLDNQISKAKSVKNQLVIYDHLLETRIKLQKLLSSSNRFVQGADYKTATKSSSLLADSLDDCLKGLRKLEKLLLEVDSFINIEEKESSQNKRKPVPNNEESLSKRFCQLSNGYRPIIDGWHERTKFTNANVKLKNFDSFEICPTKSIDQILTDKERLIHRAHLMRSQYKIIGQPEIGPEEDNFNGEIYDDDDFYHQLLRQIVENKMGDVNDSTFMTKKYIEIQRMRNKLKKQVDTRASKGRKIRYNVHEKLLNFMAPIDTTSISEEAKNELFKSLFGNFNSSLFQ